MLKTALLASSEFQLNIFTILAPAEEVMFCLILNYTYAAFEKLYSIQNQKPYQRDLVDTDKCSVELRCNRREGVLMQPYTIMMLPY